MTFTILVFKTNITPSSHVIYKHNELLGNKTQIKQFDLCCLLACGGAVDGLQAGSFGVIVAVLSLFVIDSESICPRVRIICS